MICGEGIKYTKENSLKGKRPHGDIREGGGSLVWFVYFACTNNSKYYWKFKKMIIREQFLHIMRRPILKILRSNTVCEFELSNEQPVINEYAYEKTL